MIAPLSLAGPEGAAVVFPASYDLGWTVLVVALVAAATWFVVSVVRSSLSDAAKALWIVLFVVIAPVTLVAWIILGRDARASGPARTARRRERRP
jgi:hypothetical protein